MTYINPIRELNDKLNRHLEEFQKISERLKEINDKLNEVADDDKLININFIKLNKDAICPQINTKCDAAYDLFCINDFEIEAQSTKCIPIGITIDFPQIYGYVFKIESRSSLAKEGITVEGGIIDISYKGEIKVILHNNDQTSGYMFIKGAKIAQMCLYKISNNLNFIEKQNIEFKSERDINGFGSSGN
mgnify:CR=1 FL=1